MDKHKGRKKAQLTTSLCLKSLFFSLNNYLLNTYHGPQSALDAQEATRDKTEILPLRSFHCEGQWETENPEEQNV
jgi:hypothetical protein